MSYKLSNVLLNIERFKHDNPSFIINPNNNFQGNEDFNTLNSVLDYIFKIPNWFVMNQFEYKPGDLKIILSGFEALRIPHYDNGTPVWDKFVQELLEENIEALGTTGKSVTQRAMQVANQQQVSDRFDPSNDVVAYMEFKNNNFMVNYHQVMFAVEGEKDVYNYLDDIKAYILTQARSEQITGDQTTALLKWAFEGFVQQVVFGTTEPDFNEIQNFTYNLEVSDAKAYLTSMDVNFTNFLEEIGFFNYSDTGNDDPDAISENTDYDSVLLTEKYWEWKKIHTDDGLNVNWSVNDVEGLTNSEINDFRDANKDEYKNEDDHYIIYEINNITYYYSKLTGEINTDEDLQNQNNSEDWGAEEATNTVEENYYSSMEGDDLTTYHNAMLVGNDVNEIDFVLGILHAFEKISNENNWTENIKFKEIKWGLSNLVERRLFNDVDDGDTIEFWNTPNYNISRDTFFSDLEDYLQKEGNPFSYDVEDVLLQIYGANDTDMTEEEENLYHNDMSEEENPYIISKFTVLSQVLYKGNTIELGCVQGQISFNYGTGGEEDTNYIANYKYYSDYTTELVSVEPEDELEDTILGDPEFTRFLFNNIGTEIFDYDVVEEEYELTTKIKDWLTNNINLDYQLDPNDENYMGYLNTGIGVYDDGFEDYFNKLVKHPDYWNEWMRNNLNLEMSTYSHPEEIIFDRIEVNEDEEDETFVSIEIMPDADVAEVLERSAPKYGVNYVTGDGEIFLQGPYEKVKYFIKTEYDRNFDFSDFYDEYEKSWIVLNLEINNQYLHDSGDYVEGYFNFNCGDDYTSGRFVYYADEDTATEIDELESEYQDKYDEGGEFHNELINFIEDNVDTDLFEEGEDEYEVEADDNENTFRVTINDVDGDPLFLCIFDYEDILTLTSVEALDGESGEIEPEDFDKELEASCMDAIQTYIEENNWERKTTEDNDYRIENLEVKNEYLEGPGKITGEFSFDYGDENVDGEFTYYEDPNIETTVSKLHDRYFRLLEEDHDFGTDLLGFIDDNVNTDLFENEDNSNSTNNEFIITNVDEEGGVITLDIDGTNVYYNYDSFNFVTSEITVYINSDQDEHAFNDYGLGANIDAKTVEKGNGKDPIQQVLINGLQYILDNTENEILKNTYYKDDAEEEEEEENNIFGDDDEIGLIDAKEQLLENILDENDFPNPLICFYYPYNNSKSEFSVSTNKLVKFFNEVFEDENIHGDFVLQKLIDIDTDLAPESISDMLTTLMENITDSDSLENDEEVIYLDLPSSATFMKINVESETWNLLHETFVQN